MTGLSKWAKGATAAAKAATTVDGLEKAGEEKTKPAAENASSAKGSKLPLTSSKDGEPSLRLNAWHATTKAGMENTPEAHKAAAAAHIKVAEGFEAKAKEARAKDEPSHNAIRIANDHRDTAGYHVDKAKAAALLSPTNSRDVAVLKANAASKTANNSGNAGDHFEAGDLHRKVGQMFARDGEKAAAARSFDKANEHERKGNEALGDSDNHPRDERGRFASK